MLALLFAAIFASVSKKPYVTDLPAWRPNPNFWLTKVAYWFPNFGRPVDGMDTFALLFAGITCLLLVPIWSALHNHPFPIAEWFEIVAYFIAFAVIEDCVWYAVNPAWGLRRFRRKNLPYWMYKIWLFGIPSQYWEGCLGSLGMAIASAWLREPKIAFSVAIREGLIFWSILWGTMVFLTFATSKIADRIWVH